MRSWPRPALVAVAALAAALFVLLIVLLSGSDGGGPDVRRLERATVLITGLDERGQAQSIGSGSIVSSSGLILTNAHVASPAAPGQGLAMGSPNEAENFDSLTVGVFRSEDQPVDNRYTARVVAVDGYLDVAVIQIDRTVDGTPVDPGELDLPTVPIGSSDSLQNGDDVTVVGFPGTGGGFEGSIDVVRGAVSGFEHDERVRDRRGWVKTDAEIGPGNSGGLAADEDGRLVGIPTQVNSDLKGLGTTKGRLRPVSLALPVLEAARSGSRYRSPYFVAGTRRERARFAGWAAGAPSAGCAYEAVTAYPSKAASLTAVWRVSGLAPGVDLRYTWLYYESAEDQSADLVGDTPDAWRASTPGSDCFFFGFPGQGSEPLDDGEYAVLFQAGPNLRIVGRALVGVGAAGSAQGEGDPAGPTTGTQPGSPGQPCQGWTPTAQANSGVDLGLAAMPNGQTVAEAGLFRLVQPIGAPGGYATAAEADGAAAGAISQLFGTKLYRWLVLQHQGRFFAFLAKRFDPVLTGDTGSILNPEAGPCRIPASDGSVVAWHALQFVGFDNPQWIQYDWSAATGGRFHLFGQP